MFSFEPKLPHLMPAHFGPRPVGRATGHYRDVTSIIITYLTDEKKLAAWLPPPFRLAAEPLLTVVYAMNRQIDWLAGRCYNLIEANAAVVFEGQVDRLEGFYSLVLWENLTDPILTGRELQGMPKIYADIPDATETAGQWSVVASHFGHPIVELTLGNLTELTAAQIAAGKQAMEGKNHWMGWRYLPEVGGRGTALSQFTVFPIEQVTKAAWLGQGQVAWQTATWQQNPTQCHIVNALAGLPILEYRLALLSQGSSNLYLPHNPPRVLR
jgi:acetoacetate decarboxylase